MADKTRKKLWDIQNKLSSNFNFQDKNKLKGNELLAKQVYDITGILDDFFKDYGDQIKVVGLIVNWIFALLVFSIVPIIIALFYIIIKFFSQLWGSSTSDTKLNIFWTIPIAFISTLIGVFIGKRKKLISC